MAPCDNHPREFPLAAVRDLLGMTRALYRAAAGDAGQRERIAVIGRQLRQALELARRCGPGTLGIRAAWTHAEHATAALGELVAESEIAVAPLVRAAAERLKRR